MVRVLAPPMTPARVVEPSKVTVLFARRVTAPVFSLPPPEKPAVAPNWIGLARSSSVELTKLPPSTTRVAAPKVPAEDSLSEPAFTVTEEALVRIEAPATVSSKLPVLTIEPAPFRPAAKVTPVFGRSMVRVLPAVMGASTPETSRLEPSKRRVESPPMTSDLNGVVTAN